MRALVLALFLLPALLWAAPAAAACNWSQSTAACGTREEAYAEMVALGERLKAEFEQANPGMTGSYCLIPITTEPRVMLVSTAGGRPCERYNANASGTWQTECPAGKAWDEATQTCKLGCPDGFGEDPKNPGTCLNRDKCLDRAAAGSGLISGTASSACIGGCAYAPPDGGVTLSFNGSAFVTMSKGWTPTGGSCGTAPTPNMDDPQVCKDLGDGQTACVKQDGQQCYKGPIGTAMQFCWGMGEVGDKNDGKNRQKRNAGETPIAPNLSLPSGDNLQQQGPPIVTQVTNNNTTTTTTTTNYTTQHGTDANGGGKPSNDGEPDDGSGDDDGEEGTASGGADCKSPPIVTGDQVLGMVANQAWQTRCAVEAGNAVKVTGDVGDCANPFTVEGTNASAQQLRAMRAQICGDDSNGNKRPDWTETNGTETPEPGEGDDDEPGVIAKTFSLDNLDGSGFLGGAGSCPQMGVVDLSFTQVDLSNASWWCPFVTMCRAILLLMGAFISIRLFME
jgi:hypothetical protein